jgi:hypothetical protein
MTMQAQAKPIDGGMIPLLVRFLWVTAGKRLVLKSLLPATMPIIMITQGR